MNLYGDESSNWDSIGDSLIINGYSFNLNVKTKNDYIESDRPFAINLVVSKDLGNNRESRTIFIKDSSEIVETLTTLTRIEFNPPKLPKSRIKLKFTFLTQNSDEFKWNFMENFDNFLTHFDPFVSFDTSYQVKYNTENVISGNAPNTLSLFDFNNEERGREIIYNFILMKGESEKTLFINNFGLIYTAADKSTDYKLVCTVFLNGLKKLMGFPEGEFPDSLIEVDFWLANLKKFYLKEAVKMISKLIESQNQADSTTILPPEVYKSKILPAWIKLKERHSVHSVDSTPLVLFDLIESAYHNPKLIAAAYFPDEHKFAVYLPVYLPLVLPILVALLTFIKERREKSRRERKSKERGENIKLKTQ